MQTLLWAAGGTGFPFLMTALGAAVVFFFKERISSNIQRIFLGFAAAMVGLLTMGLFDHLWYQPSLFYLFAMLAAGLSAFALSVGEERDET